MIAGTAGAETFRDCADCPEMAIIPAGSFMMGSPDDEPALNEQVLGGVKQKLVVAKLAEERPAHRVVIAQPFAVGSREVTRGEFAAFVRATGYNASGKCGPYLPGAVSWRYTSFEQNDDHPVVCVHWQDALAYIAWLSSKARKQYRLPTEAEWEYAARAGATTRWPWGDRADDACKFANVYDLTEWQGENYYPKEFECGDGYKNTARTGAFAPNAFGLFDMIGNVWEWVADCYNASYVGSPPDGSAWLTGTCDKRMTRGSAYRTLLWSSRVAARREETSSNRMLDVGFRVARTM